MLRQYVSDVGAYPQTVIAAVMAVTVVPPFFLGRVPMRADLDGHVLPELICGWCQDDAG